MNPKYNWIIERRIGFKTRPDIWDFLKLFETEEEANYLASVLQPGAQTGAGVIKEFRVRRLTLW